MRTISEQTRRGSLARSSSGGIKHAAARPELRLNFHTMPSMVAASSAGPTSLVRDESISPRSAAISSRKCACTVCIAVTSARVSPPNARSAVSICMSTEISRCMIPSCSSRPIRARSRAAARRRNAARELFVVTLSRVNHAIHLSEGGGGGTTANDTPADLCLIFRRCVRHGSRKADCCLPRRRVRRTSHAIKFIVQGDLRSDRAPHHR